MFQINNTVIVKIELLKLLSILDALLYYDIESYF